jgi:plastocyanin
MGDVQERSHRSPGTHGRFLYVWTLVSFVSFVVIVIAVQDQGPTAKPFVVTLHRYAFDPPRIEVNQDDLVKIELHSEDIAHSLTIDDYRIAKRVSRDQPVTFEFRADRAGTFPFYCNLQIEDGCRQMRGQLIVKARR